MKSIAIIPARGGSKRIPRKNVKDFLGIPIIVYSIRAALESGLFEEVMVSTDDTEIASVATQYGATVPFLRSADNSNDFATTFDVIHEVLTSYRNIGKEFDLVCCIYATAPFITSERLIEAYGLLQDKRFDTTFTCVEFSYPVLRGLVIGEEGQIHMCWPEYKNTRSQDLPKFYHDAGQFYMARTNSLLENKGFLNGNCAPLILSELEVQDLDTPTDWTIAEIKYSRLHKLE